MLKPRPLNQFLYMLSVPQTLQSASAFEALLFSLFVFRLQLIGLAIICGLLACVRYHVEDRLREAGACRGAQR